MAVIDRYGFRELAWRGALSLVVGVVVLVWRTPPLPALTVLFAAYAFVDGVLTLDLALRSPDADGRWPYVVEGGVSIAAALVTFFWPGLTLAGLFVVIGARALLLGLVEMIAAWRLTDSVATASLYGLGGFITFTGGLFILELPIVNGALLLTVLGIYAVSFGAALLALGLWYRRTSSSELVRAHRPLLPERRLIQR
jgi:uncharacterized membrane protein HdeD (DUF308 family)